MAYTVEQYKKDYLRRQLKEMSSEEVFSMFKPEEYLARLRPEEVLDGLGPELVKEWLASQKKKTGQRKK